MAVSDYKTNPDENTTISGINIAEGCPPSGINNAIRQLMADVKAESESQNKTISEKLPLSGGTMTGDIIGEKSDYFFRKTDKSGRLIFLSGPSGHADGACLYLYGNERSENPGMFQLMASNGSESNSLTGQTDGLLTWMGKSLIDASRVKTVSANSYRVALPSGGTWMYFAVLAQKNYESVGIYTGIAAGGTYIEGNNNSPNYIKAICIRVD